MIYQRISLATTNPVGDPGALPFAVANWKPEQVLDLSGLNSAYGLTDAGFWPVVDDIPAYDPATETIVAGGLTKDAPNLRFVRAWTIEAREMPPATPSIVASGNFTVVDGQIDNLSVVAGLPAACSIDVGTYWLFFSEPQPDTSYIVNPSCSQGRVNVTARAEDYFEICVKDDGGALIDPSEFSVSIVRTTQ